MPQEARTLHVSPRTPFRNVRKSWEYLSTAVINPSTEETQERRWEFQARLDHIGRSVSKRKQGEEIARSVLLWYATLCYALVSLESKARKEQ